jgi:hypothetical protein
VRQAGEVAVQLLDPSEQRRRVGFAVPAPGAPGRFLVHADSVEEHGGAVDENVLPAHLDRAEPDRVADQLAAGLNLDVVEFRLRGRPTFQARGGEAERDVTRGIGSQLLLGILTTTGSAPPVTCTQPAMTPVVPFGACRK